MSEQYNPGLMGEYERLADSETQLMTTHQNAVNETVAHVIEEGLGVVRQRMEELKSNPEFVEAVWEHLNTNTKALHQLRELDNILPPEQIAAATAPFERSVLRGLRVAAELRLNADDRDRLQIIQEEVGSLLLGQTTVIETEMPPPTSEASAPSVSDVKEKQPVVPVAQKVQSMPKESVEQVVSRPDPVAEIKPSSEADPVPDAVDAETEVSLDDEFSEYDALVFVDFLALAKESLEAMQLTAFSEQELQELAGRLIAQKVQKPLRPIDESRVGTMRRVVECLGDEEFLARLIVGLSGDDARFVLAEYVSETLQDAGMSGLRAIAKQRSLLSRFEQSRVTPIMPENVSAPEVVPKQTSEQSLDPASTHATDVMEVTEIAMSEDGRTIDDIDPQSILEGGSVLTPAEAPAPEPHVEHEPEIDRKIVAQMQQQITNLKKALMVARLDPDALYTSSRLATSTRIPLVRALGAINTARRNGLFGREEERVEQLSPRQFIAAMLYNEPDFKEVCSRPGVVDELIDKVFRAPTSSRGGA